MNNSYMNNGSNKTFDDSKAFYYNIEKKLSIVPVILMITGTIGNLLALYVLTRKRLRIYSTMLYFASLTVMDTISLYQWNFNFFYKYHISKHNSNLEESSLFACRFVSFMAYFSLQTSAWILALICIDRYLILANSQWKRKFSKNIKLTLFIIFVIILIGALLNLPVAFLNGEVLMRNKTYGNTIYEEIDCYTTSYMRFWEKTMLWFECIIPLTLMVVFNSLLIYKTHESSVKLKLIQQKEKQRQLLSTSQLTEAAKLRQQKARLSIIDKSLLLCLTKQQETQHGQQKKTDSVSNKLDTKHSMSALDLNHQRMDGSNSHDGKSQNELNIRHSSTPNLMRVNSINKTPSSGNSLAKATFLAPPSPKMRLTTSLSLSRSSSAKIAAVSNQNTSQASAPTQVKTTESLTFYLNELINKNESNSNPELTPLTQMNKRISIKYSSKSKLNETKSKKREKLINNSKLTQRRNRRIVIMLVLLTTSFAISTFPPSIFYSFFRPFLNNKPYKRLLTLTFTLLRHLSHSFNFLIYFKYSSMIKQELNTIVNCKKTRYIIRINFVKFLYFWCSNFCCCFYDYVESKLPSKYKFSKNLINDGTSKSVNSRRFNNVMRNHHDDTNHNNTKNNNKITDEYSCYQLTNTNNKSDIASKLDDEFYIDDDGNSKMDNMLASSNTSVCKSSFNSNKQELSSMYENEVSVNLCDLEKLDSGDDNKQKKVINNNSNGNTSIGGRKWKLLLYAINLTNSHDRKN